jgi:phage/plasmid-like protein (TIGR03299 family)
MAHKIYINRDAKAAMMYVGEDPWHGLGTKLVNPPTSLEAIREAGLDWEVDKFPLFAQFGKDRQLMKKVDRYALMPVDRIEFPDCPVLGVVGQDYGIVQNRDAFTFFDPIISEKLATYETAGALGEGERVWVLAKLPGDIVVHKDDKVIKYLLLVNSHTGMASVQIKLTPVRVVCNNTLTMALSFGESMRIPHFPDVKKRLEFAGATIKKVLENYKIMEASFQGMAKRPFKSSDYMSYLDNIMPIPEIKPNDNIQRIRRRERILDHREICSNMFEMGHERDPEEVKHTLWAAYNSVVYFSDYLLPLSDKIAISDLNDIWQKYEKEDLERRIKRIWFGDAATLKVRAYDTAVGLLN